MNKDEYIIINNTPIQRRIEIIKDEMEEHSYNSEEYYILNLEKTILEEITSQSTPLIPEIEKAFDAGEKYITFIVENWDDNGEGDQININKKDYISNLKLDI